MCYSEKYIYIYICLLKNHYWKQTKWVNTLFERRDLTSTQKNPIPPVEFGVAFAFKLRKQNETHFTSSF